MSTTTRHLSIGEGESWTETVDGNTPNSLEVSTNSKGAAQVTIKLYYASADEMIHRGENDIYRALNVIKAALSCHNISLAGQEGGAR